MQKYTKLVKIMNRHKLSSNDIIKNREEFLKIFPEYFNGWGKNMSPLNLQKLDDIL